MKVGPERVMWTSTRLKFTVRRVVSCLLLFSASARGRNLACRLRCSHGCRSECCTKLTCTVFIWLYKSLVNVGVGKVRITMLPQSIKSIFHFKHLIKKLLKATNMTKMLILRGILLYKAWLLQLCDVLTDNTPMFAHFIVHTLKVLGLQACRTETDSWASLSAIMSQSLSQQCLDGLGLRLNLLSDVFNVCIYRFLDVCIDLLIQIQRAINNELWCLSSLGLCWAKIRSFRFWAFVHDSTWLLSPPWRAWISCFSAITSHQKGFIMDGIWMLLSSSLLSSSTWFLASLRQWAQHWCWAVWLLILLLHLLYRVKPSWL